MFLLTQMRFWRRLVKNSFRYRYIVLLSAMAAFILACTPQGPPYQKFEKDSEVPRITLDDAKAAFDQGNAVFVDSRGDVAFNQEHIKGAISIPAGGGDERFSQLPKGKKIIVYCS